ncbi:MAG: hypothetical protein HYX89_04310 [Chloroflexi bacterium]|nr:hypothetical protein [Chloroflexota bacterium]
MVKKLALPIAIFILAAVAIVVWRQGSSLSSQETTGGPTISWEKAADHGGERIAVEGRIVRATDTGRFVFLDFGLEEGAFYVRIAPEVASLFPQPPEQMFLNKRIRVTGLIQVLKDGPQTQITDPAQIVIVGD